MNMGIFMSARRNWVVTLGVGILISACGSEDAVSEAPVLDLDDLSEHTEGATYDGWTQSIAGIHRNCFRYADFSHTLARSFGSATRGGGACATERTTATCSSDASCVATAQSLYGGAAYGYCYSGKCYTRPGSQADYCAMSPNRADGSTLAKLAFNISAELSIVGCMTKAAGPSTACGGTDSNAYMRTVFDAPRDLSPCW
jgi:hypothetical protein